MKARCPGPVEKKRSSRATRNGAFRDTLAMRSKAFRGEVLVAVTVGEHEPPDSLQPGVAGGQRRKTEPATGVVADQGHVGQVERFEELRNPPGGRSCREVRGGGRVAVSTQRLGRQDAANPVEALSQRLPQ
jgi:hypothetical protein